MSETEFDQQVSRLRAIGVEPKHKPLGLKKSDCTPEQWAAHREWACQYERQEHVRLARRSYAARHLARKGLR